MTTMPNMTLSIDKENQQKLRDIAEEERRSISKQVIFMLEFYLKYKDKVK